MAPRYRVFIRDDDLARVGELTSWISLELIIRFNAPGSWRLEVDRHDPQALLLTKTGGIIVTRDDEIIFSGSASIEYTKTQETLKVSGYDDMQYLADRVVLPNFDGPPYVDEHYVSIGPASEVMAQLVHAHLGPGARADRRVDSILVVAPLDLGDDIAVRGRFDRVIDVLAKVAASDAAGGLRFTLLQAQSGTPNTLLFDITQPADRTADAKFSVELGTAIDFEDTWKPPPANYFYVGTGEDLGANRPIYEGGSVGSIAEVGRQIEAFIEQRGVDEGSEGSQALAEAIAGSTPSRRVTVTPSDDVQDQSIVFGTTYDMGDIVTFVVDGESFVAVVREVSIKLDPERGALVTPMIGDAGTSNNPVLVQHVASLMKRTNYLEANWGIPEGSVKLPMLADPVRWPIGMIASFAAAGAPVGWVIANGDAISRTTYADLFSVIGTVFGAGNGTTTFNVPDLRNKVIVGSGITWTTGASINLPHDAHTHPGTHDHTHQHPHEHQHDYDLDHNHPSFTSGDGAGNSGTHQHSVNPPALGTDINQTESGTTDPGTTNDNTSNPQSTDFAASYGGANTAAIALLACIYSGI